MNVALLSSTSSYHYLGRLLEKESSTVYHYGASSHITPYGGYVPMYSFLPLKGHIDDKINKFFEITKDKKIDYVMAAGLTLSKMDSVYQTLNDRKIPYFFVNSKLADLERDKSITKQLLTKLGIPTPKFQKTDGNYLYENFFNIPRPFVVKLNYVYMYGMQTIIVNDENYKTVYEDLFSLYISGDHKITNIQRDTRLLIEEYVELKNEYSYHALFNKVNWQYFGAARDYKKQREGDIGPNTVSMGAYSLVDVDPVVHEYADKIYNFLKAYLQEDEYYKGFIFLGIGVDKNNVPMILEINTRSGDPELPVMLETIDNNLTELFYAASADIKIPEIKHNNKESVVVRIVNRIYDWTVPASFLPKFENIPPDIIQTFDSGPISPDTGQELKYLKHSIFTATDTTRQAAAQRIYNYLDTQHIGQYTYRRDIGILT